MRRVRNILGAALLAALTVGGVVLAQNVWLHRNQWTTSGLSGGFSYFVDTNVPSPANGGAVTGEVAVRLNSSGGDHTLEIYQGSSGSWEALAQADDGTFSGTLTAGGTVTLGNEESDVTTVNGPLVQNVFFDTFTFGQVTMVEEDYTAAVVTDASENLILLPTSQFGLIHFRYEAPAGPGFAGTADPITDGQFDLDNLTDDVDNEGVDWRVFGDPASLGYVWNEDAGNSVYFQVSVTIADISELDIFYVGCHLAGAYQDAGAYNAHDTYAFITIEDAAGDIDIETELNGGGTLNDDSGITWADGQTKVLRVTLNPDSVSFSIDGTAVTQVNAVLNADDGDEFVCGGGYVNATGDATPLPGIKVNSIELGLNQ